jgi:hypothetical protein
MQQNVRATVKEDPSLQRDGSNNAVINRNTNDYFRRLAVKRATDAKEKELQNLKSEVSELKDLIRHLIASSQNVNLSKE